VIAMIVLLTAVAVLIVGVPLAAVILVTFASWREERARSIAGQAPGNLTGAARRLLGFRATGIARPASRVASASPRKVAWPAGQHADALDFTDALDPAGALDPADALDPRGGPALAGGPVGLL
jgi:hypothetical protein